MKDYLFVVLTLLSSSLCRADELLKIATLYASEKESAAYSLLVSQFENTYSDTTVILRPYSDAEYKNRLPDLLKTGDVDVIYWQAGNRLSGIAHDLVSLDELWNENELEKVFDEQMKKLVTHNGKVYAIPYTYYQWGFFYNKKLLEELQLRPPQSWNEMLRYCDSLQEKGITSFAASLKGGWPVLAMFDYLNLRLNGRDFHKETLNGNVAFNSSAIRQVFEYWNTFLERCDFNNDYLDIGLDQATTYVLKKRASAMLTGNFVQKHIPEPKLADMGYFPFPEIKSEFARIELAPTEVWAIPKSVTNKEGAERFLRFVAIPNIQQSFNQLLSHLPANKQSHIFGNHLTVKGGELLREATEYVQYFDREAPEYLSKAAIFYLLSFIEDRNIDKAINGLEDVRLQQSFSNPQANVTH